MIIFLMDLKIDLKDNKKVGEVERYDIVKLIW